MWAQCAVLGEGGRVLVELSNMEERYDAAWGVIGTATQSVKSAQAHVVSRHHSSMKGRSRCPRRETVSRTAGLATMLTIP